MNLLAYEKLIEERGLFTLNKEDCVRLGLILMLRGVNTLGDEEELSAVIAEQLGIEHRTLQQNFVRIISKGMAQHGETARRHRLTDQRNESSVDFCLAIGDLLEESPLPLI